MIFKYFPLPFVFMHPRKHLFVLLAIAIDEYFLCNIFGISFFPRKNHRTKKFRFSVRRYIALFFVFCLSCLEEEILEATEIMEVEADEFDNRSGIFLSKAFDNIGMMFGVL